MQDLAEAIDEVLNNRKSYYIKACRERAVNKFNKEDRYLDYLRIYEKIIQQQEIKK